MARMRVVKAAWRATCLSVLALLASGAATAAVDTAAFARDDAFSDLKISPDGRHYAATVPLEAGTLLVVLRRVDNALVLRVAPIEGNHVIAFHWASDQRLIYEPAESNGRWDTPQALPYLLAVDIDGGNHRMVFGVPEDKRMASVIRHSTTKRTARHRAWLLDLLPQDPDHVLIGVFTNQGDGNSRVERLDVHTGEREVVLDRGPAPWARYWTDASGVARLALGEDDEYYTELHHRAGEGEPWVLLNRQSQTGRALEPYGFSADGKAAYLRADADEGTDAIERLDAATGERRVVLRDEHVDPGEPIYAVGQPGVLVGVRYLGRQPRTVFLDESGEDARLMRSMEAAFPGRIVRFTSATRDGGLVLLEVSSHDEPGEFLLLDVARRRVDAVVARRPWFDPADAAPTEAISVEARDGLRLDGWLTRPAGATGAMPLVLMPHGGPFGVFDAPAYNGEVQVLAAAGYAVLRVNFRGSGNRGTAFRRAGVRQWGRAMQDDLTDATHWAIKQGIAEPGRICLFGGSYGGYASLMGLVREPGLYRCAVGYVGVYDLTQLHLRGNSSRYESRKWLADWVGPPGELAAVSPTRLADRIRAPVLLVAGGRDRVAPIRHTEMMERALLKAEVPVESFYVDTEGHGFSKPANRQALYDRLLAFLDTHLGEANAPDAAREPK